MSPSLQILILGGLAQPREWELNLTLDSPEIRRMRERCNNLCGYIIPYVNYAFTILCSVSGLEYADYDPEAPLVQGLRPLRENNVRVELEQRAHTRTGGLSRIIHTYGHGGSGFSLSFGCASDVLRLVEQLQKDATQPRSVQV